MNYFLTLVLFLTACTGQAPPIPVSASVTPTFSQPSPLLPHAATRDFVQQMFARCNTKLSPARAELLRNQIARIVEHRIEGQAQQQAFIFMLCIESKFSQAAKSSAGATGIAQLMPIYAQTFATHCGLGKLEPSDIQDVETNLHLGACFFNSLVKQTNNVYLAAAAYNAGLSSSSVKNLKALSNPVHETAAYVAKVALLQAEQGLQP